MARFVHQPLPEPSRQIRLLRFLSDCSEDHTDLEISTWPLSNAPAYCAISYAWGDGNLYPIIVNGLVFDVRWNCRYALFQAQLHHRKEYVWIDCICIDQDNTEEKSAQVAMMFEIYSGASGVLASLGPQANGSKLLMRRALRRQSSGPWIERAIKKWIERARKTWIGRVVRYRDTVGSYQVTPAQSKFERRSYWSRLWIIQELFAADGKIQLLCGADSFPWTVLHSFAQIRHPIRNDTSGKHVCFANLEWQSVGNLTKVIHAIESLDLDNAINAFLTFSCTDPRDRLYGTLPLIRWPTGCEPISPDYNKTGYDLAIRLADFVRAVTLERMLPALRVSYKSGGMADLIVARQTPAPSMRDVECKAREFKRWDLVKGPINCLCTVIGRLMEDGAENLSTRMFDSAQWAPLSSESNREAPAEDKPTSELFDVRLLRNREPRYVTTSSAFTHPSDAFALACSEARQGDLMVQFSESITAMFLILRHNHGFHFDIIGQAISIRESESYDSCTHEVTPAAELEADVQVSFTAEDKLVLVGQDLEDDPVDYERNATEYVKRVFTCPVLDPTCAVRIVPKQTSGSRAVEEWMSKLK